MADLDILSLTCVKTEDPNTDEISLYIDGIRIYGPAGITSGDVITIPLGNQPLRSHMLRVELMEEDGATAVQLGTVIITDTLPLNHDLFGIFDDELPSAFYFMKYQLVP
jgi:hypothetical protein